MTYYKYPYIFFNKEFIDYNNIKTTKENSDICINKTLKKYLNDTKNSVQDEKEWDKYKKYTNTYEYIQIQTNKLFPYLLQPLSRSYYKMIEIIKVFNICENKTPIRTFHFAEGPGGFVQALIDIRKNPNDVYNTMTLIDDDINVPGWKKSQVFLNKNKNVKVEYGQDKTGDLSKYHNLLYCYKNYNQTIDLVTADGGFDFSDDYNNQEQLALKLILYEISHAILVQKKGGTFILKVFDTFTYLSVDIIYLLSLLYENVHIIKPQTSRNANSEKYLVCNDFRLHDISFILPFIKNIYSCQDNIYRLFKHEIPCMYINKIEEYNSIYGQQQMENIIMTLNLINLQKKDSDNKLENIKKNNLLKCLKWCENYLY